MVSNKHGFVIAVIYVDDAPFCGPNKALVQELKEKFMKRWECQDLGDVTKFLCMKVHRDGSKINLDQCAYLETVLERCGMQNCKSAAAPLPAGYMPEPMSQETAINPELQRHYQMVFGSLLYLMIGTRPDIMFAVTCQSPYFIFALFALLTSLLVKYSHSHPPYSLRYLFSLATFIRSAQRHHAHPLLTFFFPFTNSRIPQGQEANRCIGKTRTAVH